MRSRAVLTAHMELRKRLVSAHLVSRPSSWRALVQACCCRYVMRRIGSAAPALALSTRWRYVIHTMCVTHIRVRALAAGPLI